MSIKQRIKRLGIRSLVIYIASAVLMMLLANLFIVDKALCIPAGLLSGVGMSIALERLLAYRGEKVSREQTELLLQFLSTETSAGKSLDTAFMDAPMHFAKLYSKKNRFQAGLEEIATGLRLQMPLHALIRDFATRLESPEAAIVLQVLTTMDFSGTDLPDLLHQEARILGDIKRIERQVQAEHASQSMESIILALMPFPVMLMLQTGAADYMQDSFTSSFGQLMLAGSYVLAITALILNILFRAKAATKLKDESLIRLKQRLAKESSLSRLAARLQDYLPKTYVLRLYASMRILWSLRDDNQTGWIRMQYEAGIDEVNVWCQLKILWFVLAIPLLIVCGLLGMPLLYIMIILIAVPLAQDQELFSRANRYQNELMQSLPLFISLMNQLLKSGMVVRRALLFSIRQMPTDSAFYRELQLIELSMNSGQNAAAVLGEFSARLDVPEAQSALLLLARQETHGGGEMLRQLDQASRDCWSILGNAYRKKHEMLSQRLFLPMIMDMFSIILMSAAPALLMFMQY